MKKKYILMGVAATLLVTAIAGGSLAYFQADGENVQQQINTKSLSIDLIGSGNENTKQSVLVANTMPGEQIEKNVKVENTADTPLYTRVTIRKYWGDFSNDNLTKDFDKDTSKILIPTLENWYISTGEGDDETLVMYYQDPIQPGESVDVMYSLEVSPELNNTYANLGIGLDVEAEAVQAFAAQDAILSEWGVWAEIDGDHIVYVEE
ncbi:MAG: M73 family metallopeptidase [Candidatus Ruminococcus intestinipullorum]|nr:M73 family metallopeptidase [Candidatus Ruminococcus intestinipullorum]